MGFGQGNGRLPIRALFVSSLPNGNSGAVVAPFKRLKPIAAQRVGALRRCCLLLFSFCHLPHLTINYLLQGA
jgi:hypothetical protein